jgi:hypothetical protein
MQHCRSASTPVSSALQTCLISCRDDDAETPDRSHKPIPEWARSQVLYEALRAQQATDPDSIFGARQTTCDLGDMFAGGWLRVLRNGRTLGFAMCIHVLLESSTRCCGRSAHLIGSCPT